MKTVQEEFREWGNAIKELGTDYFNIEGRLWRAFRAGYAAAKAEAPQWQPIESAKRDGTVYLITNGNWIDSGWFSTSMWLGGNSGWVTDDERESGIVHEDITHWMPRPLTPEAKP